VLFEQAAASRQAANNELTAADLRDAELFGTKISGVAWAIRTKSREARKASSVPAGFHERVIITLARAPSNARG
jgi:hypothetical protein